MLHTVKWRLHTDSWCLQLAVGPTANCLLQCCAAKKLRRCPMTCTTTSNGLKLSKSLRYWGQTAPYVQGLVDKATPSPPLLLPVVLLAQTAVAKQLALKRASGVQAANMAASATPREQGVSSEQAFSRLVMYVCSNMDSLRIQAGIQAGMQLHPLTKSCRHFHFTHVSRGAGALLLCSINRLLFYHRVLIVRIDVLSNCLLG